VKLGCAAALTAGRAPGARAAAGPTVNDVHSQLNATLVDHIARPVTVTDVQTAVRSARALRMPISIAGGRHAMGGQQFGASTKLVDMRAMTRVIDLDLDRGEVEAEAGIMWPELLAHLKRAQEGRTPQWGIVQKQTGADRLSLGGALAANVHGRGLAFKPLVDQLEAFTIVDHTGEARRCSRTENPELFRLAVGGYGLFGIVTSVRLRLWHRRKVERVVELRDVDGLVEAFEQRIADGYLYGDFQYATDAGRKSFMRRGVFSCYRPVVPETPVTPNPRRFLPEDWARLTYYAHKYKGRAFDVYGKRYLETSGQVYWSDDQLSAAYVDNYHADVDRKLGSRVKATEMITEIYVPRHELAPFMAAAREELRRRRANVIYGTIRLIEEDDVTFLRWAKQRYACVIFNLHVEHTPDAIDAAAGAFRALIDLAIARDGSFYLTYHRWATREQIDACYPQFDEFLRLKREHDPHELFASDWYRHYRGRS
jgi:FAD/FMN-containing dehydrogenase